MVRRVRHLAGPGEGADRTGRRGANVSRSALLLKGHVECERRRVTGASEEDVAWERNLVNDRYIRQRNRHSVFRDLYGVIRDLNNPEKSAGSDPAIEVMHLCLQRPRTREPEINSYQYKGAVCPRRDEARGRTDVVTLKDAEVGDDLIASAGAISGVSQGVTHRDLALDVLDHIGFDVAPIETDGWIAWGVRIDGWRNHIAPGDGDRKYLGWSLSPRRNAAEDGHGKTNCSLHGDALVGVC